MNGNSSKNYNNKKLSDCTYFIHDDSVKMHKLLSTVKLEIHKIFKSYRRHKLEFKDFIIKEYKLVPTGLEFKASDLIKEPLIQSNIKGVKIKIYNTACIINDNNTYISIKDSNWNDIKTKLLRLGYITDNIANDYEKRIFKKL